VQARAYAVDDDRRVEHIHPAIDRALSAYAPEIAEPAACLIAALLEERMRGGAAECWRGSRLTGDGFPFELSFCTADDRLRFTVEPGQSNLDPAGRLDVALALLERLEGRRVPADIVGLWRAMQRCGPLKYGAWIGGRVSREGSALKVYVEVPAEWPAGALPRPRLTLADRAAAVRMVSYVPAREATEIYLRIPSLEPRHVPAILEPAGLEARAGELVALVTEAYGFSITGRLPGPSIGVSYVVDPPRSAPVSIHFYARALWGSDARIRRQFPRLAAGSGWEADAYLQASAPLATRDTWTTCHGLVGIAVGSADMSFTLGLRPVEA
jgi:hypothetical protein